MSPGHDGIDAVFVDHQLRGEFQEGEDACIEHQTEQCDEPEPLVGDYEFDVAEFESLLLFALRGGDRFVEPSVHYAVDQIGQQSDAERQRAEKYGIGDSTPCRGDAGAEKKCGGRSQTRHGHLQAERQRQFMAGEPFDDHF